MQTHRIFFSCAFAYTQTLNGIRAADLLKAFVAQEKDSLPPICIAPMDRDPSHFGRAQVDARMHDAKVVHLLRVESENWKQERSGATQA